MSTSYPKHLGLWLLLMILQLTAYSQIEDARYSSQPYSFQDSKVSPSTFIPKEITPAIDQAALEREDLINDANGVMPMRFGIEQTVNYNLNNSGHWERLPNGDRLWRLRIEAPKALSINLIYDDFYIPSGARLYLYDKTGEQVIGAFSDFNNKPTKEFGTALVYGDLTTLEYYEPAHIKERGRIRISTVVHGYRNIWSHKNNSSLGNSGSCNIDSECSPDGDPWRDEIKAIAKIIVGGGICSGSLLANTNRDCTPLFLTANHCGFNSNTIFYWRFERPNCGTGTPDDTKTTTGAIRLAQSIGNSVISESDFSLWELTESPVDAGYDVYFLGWDARNIIPSSVVGIHHPSGDAKKICYENDPLTPTNYNNNTTGSGTTHWRIAAWDTGTTEGGSSGSPIMDQVTHRVVGKLSGGQAACNGSIDNDEPDWYGKFSYSWLNAGAGPANRLIDWLDNANTGELFIDGYDLNNCLAPTCNDGIRNQNETAIDCGGPYCLPCPCETTVTLTLLFDNYPEETSWNITNSNGIIVAAGDNYGSQADGSTLTIPGLCVDLDCLNFTIFDTASDGLCCDFGIGAYTLTNDLDGSTLASGDSFTASEVTNFCIDGVSVNLKLMLKGPYNGTDMNTDLGSALIPLTSPYGDGLTTTAATINTFDIVDWVEVQLRSTVGPSYNILAKRGALLKKDGTIVHTDGFTYVTFPEANYPGIIDGNYRVAIQHRNHLGVMTGLNYTLE